MSTLSPIAPLVPQPVPLPIGERRIVLRQLTWQDYLTIRDTLRERRNAHLTYDREC